MEYIKNEGKGLFQNQQRNNLLKMKITVLSVIYCIILFVYYTPQQ